MSEPSKDQKQIKVGIVNFTRLLKKYEPQLDPSLVNETNPQGWTGKYVPTENAGALPTFDQFLNTCFHALQDITLFIKEHEQVKYNLGQLQEDSVDVHKLLMSAGISAESMKDGVGIILSRFKQSLDVVYKASTIHPHGLVKFQTAAREFVLRFLSKEKANDLYGDTTGSSQPSSDQASSEKAEDGKDVGGTDSPVS